MLAYHNYNEKIAEIKSQITSGLKRYLNVLGRVTVVRSLLISKLNYLNMSLPYPSGNVLREIHALFYSFVWEGKPIK